MMRLYFGLRISEKYASDLAKGTLVHCPLITIQPFPFDEQIQQTFCQIDKFTHIILTSKEGVRLFFQALSYSGRLNGLEGKCLIAVGKATAQAIQAYGQAASHIAEEESSEGITKLLSKLDLNETSFLWPCSALSRMIIPSFLAERQVPYRSLPLYTTVPNEAITSTFLTILPQATELIFTSPSTVEAFISLGGIFLETVKVAAIGPITAAALKKLKPKDLNKEISQTIGNYSTETDSLLAH